MKIDDGQLTSGFMDEEGVESAFLTSSHVISGTSSGASWDTSFSDLQLLYESHSGHSCLYRCVRMGKMYVLKGLKKDCVYSEMFQEALRKEFAIGFQLDHPHICRTLDWEDVDGLGPCLLVEYVDGLSLRELMKQGRLTRSMALKIISELCSALMYIHSKQIIHRDLKPENILITHNGQNVKLIDFGLSDSDDFNVLKIPAGTRRYMAPEAMQGKEGLDLRADIYSLGMIIGEMGEGLHDHSLAAVSRKCVQRRREKRYASAAEVLQAVRRPVYPFRWMGGTALVALLVGGAAFFAWQTERSSSAPASALSPVSGLSSAPVGTNVPVVATSQSYGNQVLSAPCRQALDAECQRMLRDSVFVAAPAVWQQDSLQSMQRLKQALDAVYPLPQMRRSPAYQAQWKALQQQAQRQFTQLRQQRPLR